MGSGRRTMETEQLIQAIARDGRKPLLAVNHAFLAAAVVATLIAALVFAYGIGPRADIGAAAQTLPFLFKFVVTIALFGTAFAALFALAHPGDPARSELPMLFLAPILLAVAVSLVLSLIPSREEAMALMMGTNWRVCLTFIPLIGLGPLAAFLLALRNAAPTRPTLAGAVAGMVAGGLAATFYAAHCTDDSPLFVATWYTIGVAILTLIGGLAGRYLVRW
jgi:hypothetical protein